MPPVVSGFSDRLERLHGGHSGKHSHLGPGRSQVFRMEQAEGPCGPQGGPQRESVWVSKSHWKSASWPSHRPSLLVETGPFRAMRPSYSSACPGRTFRWHGGRTRRTRTRRRRRSFSSSAPAAVASTARWSIPGLRLPWVDGLRPGLALSQ